MCRDVDGKILTEKEHIQRRWKDYFENVLVGNLVDIDSMTFRTVENEDIQPSYEEVTYVIKSLKKSQGTRNRQNNSRTSRKRRESLEKNPHLIKLIWTQYKMPEEWSMGIIQPIYKKGDKLESSNYRAITLFNITYKVLSGILYNRLTKYAEEIV